MTGPELRVIGTIRTRHHDVQHTPVQAALNPDDEGTVELEPRYLDALEGLDEFTHLWLLTWLAPLDEPVEAPELRQVPFLLRRRPRQLGILAMRGPRRPNPIGLSLVRLVSVEGTSIRFAGVDMVDGALLIDLKPYVRPFDQPWGAVRCGWFDSLTFEGDVTPAGLAEPDSSTASGDTSLA